MNNESKTAFDNDSQRMHKSLMPITEKKHRRTVPIFLILTLFLISLTLTSCTNAYSEGYSLGRRHQEAANKLPAERRQDALAHYSLTEYVPRLRQFTDKEDMDKFAEGYRQAIRDYEKTPH